MKIRHFKLLIIISILVSCNSNQHDLEFEKIIKSLNRTIVESKDAKWRTLFMIEAEFANGTERMQPYKELIKLNSISFEKFYVLADSLSKKEHVTDYEINELNNHFDSCLRELKIRFKNDIDEYTTLSNEDVVSQTELKYYNKIAVLILMNDMLINEKKVLTKVLVNNAILCAE